MFNGPELLYFLDSHVTLPHISRYHYEGYREHCLLVVDEIAKRTQNTVLIIAACLHDIGKPRSQTWNKKGETSFKRHEEITDAELAQFLSLDDFRFIYVKALVLCHMVPIRIATTKNYDKAVIDECKRIFKANGVNLEVDDEFINNLYLLHEADEVASIKNNEMLKSIKKRCERAYKLVYNLE